MGLGLRLDWILSLGFNIGLVLRLCLRLYRDLGTALAVTVLLDLSRRRGLHVCLLVLLDMGLVINLRLLGSSKRCLGVVELLRHSTHGQGPVFLHLGQNSW